MSSQIGSFLLMLLQQLPEMLVYLVGLVATLVLRRRAPVALSIATIGFGWLLLMTFVQPLLWQGLLMAIEGSPPERMATIFPIAPSCTRFISSM